jgi:hypothetical protein
MSVNPSGAFILMVPRKIMNGLFKNIHPMNIAKGNSELINQRLISGLDAKDSGQMVLGSFVSLL